MVSDALSANAPHINELKSLGYGFIIVVKPEGNRSLYTWSKGITKEIKIKEGKNSYLFRYINNVPLNDTKDAPMVNFLECEWIEISGKQQKKGSCSWVTSHEIVDDNVYEIMRAEGAPD